jgi:hypothetical protein
MIQASQRSVDGTTLYRWYVFVGRTRFVTWAPTVDAAIAKTQQRAAMKGLRVDRVEPAPPLAP